ncbi:MAG TPA: transposase [Schlesneria sp.]
MPRASRITPGGMVFHVLNRGVGRQRLFDETGDYAAFEDVIEETLVKQSMRICSYCVTPNHWHLLLWPEGDGDLAAFIQRLTVTHVTHVTR